MNAQFKSENYLSLLKDNISLCCFKPIYNKWTQTAGEQLVMEAVL